MDLDEFIREHKIPIRKPEETSITQLQRQFFVKDRDLNEIRDRDSCFVMTYGHGTIEGIVTDVGAIFIEQEGWKDVIQVDHKWYWSTQVTKRM